ncbi:response regulator [Verrucomicrobia bacterium]|nr:response regulator [Verrucomicrobiota bacterium]MDB4746180.1 response regulator [Verrucomicrobiota bacterium]MDB4798779.1 response regulator [Verrucomicrobiota bacterium]
MEQKKLNILLVEDDDGHAELVTFNLEEAGILNSLDRACDGVEALDYLREKGANSDSPTPDLVLLDLKLPKVDGLEVLATVKNDEKLKSIPIVVLSTSDSDRDQQAAYANHANGYLVKPMDFEDFCQMVQDFGIYWGKWNRFPRKQAI